METTFIYALNDPETGECRYVGKADDPHDRLFGSSGHLYDCKTKTHHCANWLKSLVARGLVPLLEILQEVPRTEWELWERVWIKASRKIGMDLTNGTDGGDCPPRSKPGRKFSPEACARMSAARLGKKLSPEHRAKISAAGKGRKFSSEHRAKIGASQLGKKLSPEHCSNISASQLGKKLSLEHRAKLRGKHPSPETRAKMSAAHKGKNPSPETRAKLSASKLGKKPSPEARAKMRAAQKRRRGCEKVSRQLNFSNE